MLTRQSRHHQTCSDTEHYGRDGHLPVAVRAAKLADRWTWATAGCLWRRRFADVAHSSMMPGSDKAPFTTNSANGITKVL